MNKLKAISVLLIIYFTHYNPILISGELLDSKVDIKAEIANITAYMREWASSLSQELASLSKLARKQEVEKSFEKYDINEENWNEIIEEVAENIRVMMKEKIKAVHAIKQHAELLSKHRKEDITRDSSYDYYDANNLTQTEDVEDRMPDIDETERYWKCSIPENLHGRYDLCFDNSYKSYQSDEPYPIPMGVIDKFSYRNTSRLLSSMGRCNKNAFLYRPKDYYSKMNMKYHAHFDEAINLNYSIVRVTPTVYKREDEMINEIRWSEALDLTFKCNFRRDPTLTYQYFGSPKGFMRFYPATQWSNEQYNDTIDFRVRSWFIEAIASAKDIVILVDTSGSMMSNNRRNISNQIVNSILDTLTDNDYVNIYTFNNKTQSLVDCFNNSLVQANEENLRLLRERLAKEKDPFFPSNITIGLIKAFEILRSYRLVRGGGMVCNQAIMLITEGVDYEGYEEILKMYNEVPEEKYYRPVRVFTYLLGKEPMDAQRMTWIACANMGYYVNITYIEEVREKVLKYLVVLSRPINLNPHIEPEPAWTALYVHLTDRRHANWLWRKHEGNKQRDIIIEYERKHMQQQNLTLKENQTHFTTQPEHPYEPYLKSPNYHYLTSVSLPVFDLSDEQPALLGVAGVDVPLDYLQQLAEPDRIGVNGYSFTITNNGYVLHHPDHRTEFGDYILKPTFNRVDVTEVEISDKTYEPRKFDQDIIDLREEIVFHKKRSKSRIRKLRIRQPIDDMKRVMVSSRHYFHTKIGPFSLVIALPDGYGFFVSGMKVDAKQMARIKQDLRISLNKTEDWRVNPKWLYTCNSTRAEKSPEKELLHFLHTNATFCKEHDLVNALLKDAYATEWFHQNIQYYNHVKQTSIYYKGVVLTFMATHTGLTRWKDLKELKGIEHFADEHNKATDEIFYRRGAEMNYNKSHMFIYSVPHKEYKEAETLITASHVIFLKREGKRAPIAAVGYQMLHKTLNKILKTFHCGKPTCNIACSGPNSWICYVIDNDGYIILANDTTTIGKSLVDVDIPLMKMLVKDDVFKEITVFDYQGTCYPIYSKPRKEPFYGPGDDVINDKDKKCIKPTIKCKTLAYLRMQVKKTTPTPCDIELKLYNYQFRSMAHLHPDQNDRDCPCPYITEPIKGTNLLLLALDRKKMCCDKESSAVPIKEYPKEIIYNLTLPCHIAVNNNFTKRHYTKCITKHVDEYKLNQNTSYCGGEGMVPLE